MPTTALLTDMDQTARRRRRQRAGGRLRHRLPDRRAPRAAHARGRARPGRRDAAARQARAPTSAAAPTMLQAALDRRRGRGALPTDGRARSADRRSSSTQPWKHLERAPVVQSTSWSGAGGHGEPDRHPSASASLSSRSAAAAPGRRIRSTIPSDSPRWPGSATRSDPIDRWPSSTRAATTTPTAGVGCRDAPPIASVAASRRPWSQFCSEWSSTATRGAPSSPPTGKQHRRSTIGDPRWPRARLRAW